MKPLRIIALTVAAFCFSGTAPAEETNSPLPSIRIIQLEEAPDIDGELTDAAWGQIAHSQTGVLSGWTLSASSAHALDSPLLADQQRVAYVGYDPDNLYIAMQSYATDIYQLRGGRGGNPFVGECLEIFIRTEEGKLFHIGIDVDGNINTGLVGEQINLAAINKEVGFGENYWVLEIAIPWSLLGVEPEKGTVLGFNLGANSSQQRGSSAVISWGPKFGAAPGMPSIQLD